MVSTDIEKAIEPNIAKAKEVNISFKQRNNITGYFVKAKDYEELKAKNYWRVVNPDNMEQWRKTKDVNLTRLFNGTEFSKLK